MEDKKNSESESSLIEDNIFALSSKMYTNVKVIIRSSMLEPFGFNNVHVNIKATA